MKKWIYIAVLVTAALTLAVGGWIIEGIRAAARPPRKTELSPA